MNAVRRPMLSDIDALREALSHIHEHNGRTVVVKFGGAAMGEPSRREDFARDVVMLKAVGLNPVVVHGAGPEITSRMQRLGMPVKFVAGLRVSDSKTVEVVRKVLGEVNDDLVLRLNGLGQPAVGMCAEDGALLRVERQAGPAGEDIGFVGRIKHVDADKIARVAESAIPVIASAGADREGHAYNVNADATAAAVAEALNAHKILFLTDVVGWLRNPPDPESLIARAHVDEVAAAIDGTRGGMQPKLHACMDAIEGGVSSAHIIDGRVKHSLLLELFTNTGIGTTVQPDPTPRADAPSQRGDDQHD